MLEKIPNHSLVIIPNNLKNKLLKEISQNKKLINIKMMTKEEFIQNYYGKIKTEATYFLMKEFHLNFSVAQKYLKNIFVNHPKIKKYYDYLMANNLIEKNPLFNPKNITIIGYPDLEPYLLNELKKYNLNITEETKNDYLPKVYEFSTMQDEIAYVATQIAENLKTKSPSEIFITGLTNDYIPELKRIFSLYKIPLNINNKISIYSTSAVQTFLKNLTENKDLNIALEKTPNGEVKNKIIDLLNQYNLPVDETYLTIIKEKLKKLTIPAKKYDNAVNVISLNEINDKDKIYYILGFNQELIPKIYKDDDLIADDEKPQYNLLTSTKKNIIQKKVTERLIKSSPNITITYKLKDTFSTYYPSSLISELNLEVIKNPDIKYIYSNLFNKLTLSKYLDDYLNYNQKDKNLDILWSNYSNIDYGTYDNKYHQINKENLMTYLQNKLTLSYTSLNNYSLCPFKYYANNILKLDPYEETFPILIGNLFHYCLSHLYDENFNLETEYRKYLKDKELSPKEKFYLKRLYKVLEKDIEIIKKEETHTTYNKHLTEKKLTISKSQNPEINFTGIIDKVSYNENHAIITDYKTGSVTATLDNLNYSLNMQLPIYLYLIKNSNLGYNVMGIYLQKLLNTPALDSENPDKEIADNLKLSGYTVNDEDIIQEIDDTYENSELIKGLKKTKNGFSSYSKLLNYEDFDKIYQITEDNINKTIKNILEGNFEIKPKRIDNENISCKNCPFKDLCFFKEEDIKNLKNTKITEILGGEENAKMD